MSHVVLTCPLATLESRDTTRTMAKTIVMIPKMNTTPTLSFCAVDMRRL